MELLSLHLPKTAGTTFLAALEEYYGDRLLQDYQDRPLNHSPFVRNTKAITSALRLLCRQPSGVDCIHGHFLLCKYLLLAKRSKPLIITWLRDPLERLCSHYEYWVTHTQGKLGPLHRKVLDEGWTRDQFCCSCFPNGS